MRVAVLGITALILLALALALFELRPLSLSQRTTNLSYAWELIDAGLDATGTPRTLVILDAPGNSYSIGIESGSCWSIAGTVWNLLPREMTSVMCWRSDGGTEIGVFDEGVHTAVKESPISFDDVIDQSHRGPFRVLFDL